MTCSEYGKSFKGTGGLGIGAHPSECGSQKASRFFFWKSERIGSKKFFVFLLTLTYRHLLK